MNSETGMNYFCLFALMIFLRIDSQNRTIVPSRSSLFSQSSFRAALISINLSLKKSIQYAFFQFQKIRAVWRSLIFMFQIRVNQILFLKLITRLERASSILFYLHSRAVFRDSTTFEAALEIDFAAHARCFMTRQKIIFFQNFEN